MAKQKTRTIQLSDLDKTYLDQVFKAPAKFATGVALTIFSSGDSTNIRMTFTEKDTAQNKTYPVTAVALSLDDVQLVYNAMTTLLQQMRELGRIK